MKAGLFGFALQVAVSSILLLNKGAQFTWVIRKSKTLQLKSVFELLGINSNEAGPNFSMELRKTLGSSMCIILMLSSLVCCIIIKKKISIIWRIY